MNLKAGSMFSKHCLHIETHHSMDGIEYFGKSVKKIKKCNR